MTARLAALASAAALACASVPAPPAAAPVDARAALDRFTAAVQAGRWDEAWALLSPRWRTRTTPARLREDLTAAGPAGAAAVERVRALLAAGAPVEVSGDEATLAVGEGRTARLVREGGGFRVDALE